MSVLTSLRYKLQESIYVCFSPQAQPKLVLQVHVKLNIETMTVRSFEERILKGALNMVAPDAEIDGKGVILISSEEVNRHLVVLTVN